MLWDEKFWLWFWNTSEPQVNERQPSPWSTSYRWSISVTPTWKCSTRSGWRWYQTWCRMMYLLTIGFVTLYTRRFEIRVSWCSTSSSTSHGLKEIKDEAIATCWTSSKGTSLESEKTSMWPLERSTQETLQVVANPLLLRQIQLLLHQMPIRKRRLKPLPRRRQHLRRRPRLRQLQFYHHLNQNSMQKEKGKVKGKETGDQTAEVLVLDPRRRSHATSISSRKHAEKAKIVNTVTTKRCLMRTRTRKVMVESQELREVNLQRTRPRRLMNHAGTGLRASADMETNATNVTILIYSTLLRTPKHQAQRLLLHLSMNGVMTKGHSTRLHRMSSRRRSDSMSPRLASKRTWRMTSWSAAGNPRPSPKVMVKLVSPPIR